VRRVAMVFEGPPKLLGSLYSPGPGATAALLMGCSCLH
jgi:hypothetical protein